MGTGLNYWVLIKQTQLMFKWIPNSPDLSPCSVLLCMHAGRGGSWQGCERGNKQTMATLALGFETSFHRKCVGWAIKARHFQHPSKGFKIMLMTWMMMMDACTPKSVVLMVTNYKRVPPDQTHPLAIYFFVFSKCMRFQLGSLSGKLELLLGPFVKVSPMLLSGRTYNTTYLPWCNNQVKY